MAAIGDSITAGTLADLPLPKQIKPGIIYKNPYSLSWATGRKFPSHAVRLADYLKKEGYPSLSVLNVAIPGATTMELKQQAQSVVQAVTENRSRLAYVTLLIGANDACLKEGPDLSAMRARILLVFEMLAALPQKEKIPILLVGIPKIPELGDEDIRADKTILGLKCQTIQGKILHFCDPLLKWKTPEEYQEKIDLVESVNRMLRNLPAQAMQLFPKLDIVFSQQLYEFDIPADLLAIDCFHPNGSGQEQVAEQLWADQPWFHTFSQHPSATPCRAPQVTLTGPDLASQGQDLSYTITLKNPGSCDLSGLTLTDFLPRETQFVSSTPPSTPTSGGYPPKILHTEWDLVDLPASSQKTFQVQIQSASPAGRTITNTVCIERDDVGRICAYADTSTE